MEPESETRWLRRYRSDPCGFAKALWPHLVLTEYQERILKCLVVTPEVWVRSANGVGKTLVAALSAIWFFATRTGIVVAISSKQDQLEKALWNEIELLLRSATWNGQPVDFGFSCKQLEIRHRLDNGRALPKSYMMGRCVSQDENLAGVHLARLEDGTPTVLFICEEASGIDDRLWPVIRTSAHRILVIGNPIRTDGEFYRICAAGPQAHYAQPGKLQRDVITVSGEDSPNVRIGMACAKEGLPLPDRPAVPGVLSYETFLELKASLPPWSIRPRLYGLPNDDTTTKLFPASCLDLAQELYQRLKEYEASLKARDRPFRWGGRLALGVDCAMGGGDLSAWAIYGKYGVVDVEVIDTPNTRRIKGHTLQLMRKLKIAPEWVAFDRAIGGVIADEMREQGFDVEDVGFGKKAFDDGKYVNRRVELYGELSRTLRRMVDDDGKPTAKTKRLLDTPVGNWEKSWRCVALPPDAKLREELFILPQCEDGEGRLCLPPKSPRRNRPGIGDDSIKGMLGRSPDRADAVVLAKYAFDRGEEYRRLSSFRGPLVY
jgi:hypothetical protein